MTNTKTATIEAMTDGLIEIIVAENLLRSAANAAEPYVHANYKVHEDRIHRLVQVIADGNEELSERFFDALFDITYDGVAWAIKTFAELNLSYVDHTHELDEEQAGCYARGSDTCSMA